MEKLINLLNEYCGEDEGSETKWLKEHLLKGGMMSLKVISKEFGFIKWLVENDKIDYHNKINYHISLAIHWREKRTTREERLLMMLAIQDEPIKFLCSLLK